MNLKHVLVGIIVLAVCILGGLWLFLRQVPPSSLMSSFQRTCIETQRRSIAGETWALDEDSEAKALTYCRCLEGEVSRRLTGSELAELGLSRQSKETEERVALAIARCRDEVAPPNSPP